MKTKNLGRYVVADPKICHGQPTFRGTRILVADVLERPADESNTRRVVGEVTALCAQFPVYA